MNRLAILVGLVCVLQPLLAQEHRDNSDRHVVPAYERELEQRLKRNPRDVDSLIALGLYYDDLQRSHEALPLFERAVELKPDAKTYYFAGLTSDRVASLLERKAEGYVRKALELDPSLENDLNVRAFLKRHTKRVCDARLETPTLKQQVRDTWLAQSNLFLVGLGAGLLLATPFLYFAIRKRRI